MMKFKIFIIDDHPLVREWLTHVIQNDPVLVVCGEGEDAFSALPAMEAAKPDLAIVDISLDGGSGIELIRFIAASFPKVAVIALSMHDERVYAERTIRAGARGYIMKSESTKKIVEAIHEVLAGNLYLSEVMRKSILSKRIWIDGSDNAISQLSDRELEVFKLLGQGYGCAEIASKMRVNFKTVHTYCARIKVKLEISTGAELLREAIRWSALLQGQKGLELAPSLGRPNHPKT